MDSVYKLEATNNLSEQTILDYILMSTCYLSVS